MIEVECVIPGEEWGECLDLLLSEFDSVGPSLDLVCPWFCWLFLLDHASNNYYNDNYYNDNEYKYSSDEFSSFQSEL